jgi:hypothetical protein
MDDDREILRRLEHLHVRLEILETIRKGVSKATKSVQDAATKVLNDRKNANDKTPGTAEQFDELLQMLQRLHIQYDTQRVAKIPDNATLGTFEDPQTRNQRQVINLELRRYPHKYQFFVYANGRCLLTYIDNKNNRFGHKFVSIQEAEKKLREYILGIYNGAPRISSSETI